MGQRKPSVCLMGILPTGGVSGCGPHLGSGEVSCLLRRKG